MMKLYAFAILMLFCVSYSFSQNNKPLTKVDTKNVINTKKPCATCPGNTVEKPADFPKFIDTGNPTEDEARYAAAKREWIEKNPELYEKMNPRSENSEAEKVEKAKKEAIKNENK